MEQSCENGFNKCFLMNKYEYFHKFGFINHFLYDNLKIEQDEKKVWDELIKNGIYNYFDKKMRDQQ